MKFIFRLLPLFVIVFSTLFFSCEKDSDVTVDNEIQSRKIDVVGHFVKGDSIRNVNKDLDLFIGARFEQRNTSSLEDITSNIYGFTLNTDRILQLSGSTYTNYIFNISRDNSIIDGFENYMLTVFNNGSYMQVLIHYPLIGNAGTLEPDVSNAFVTYINDASLLSGIETSPCPNTTEEILSWDAELNCIDINCSAGGNHSYGQSCDGNADEQPMRICSGGWVVTGCITSGGGSSGSGTGPFTPPSGGSQNPDDPTNEIEEVPVVPLVPAWQEIEMCVNNNLNIGNLLSDDDIAWLSNRNNGIQVNNINDYIQSNGCNTETIIFIDEVIDVLRNNGEVDFEEQIFMDSNFVNNQRLKCVYDKFKTGTNKISNYLNNFLADNSVAHLNFKIDNNFKTNYTQEFWGAGAVTVPPINAVNGNGSADYNIDIIFNTDPSLAASEQNMPTIILACEMIHEMIHAEIYRKLMECAQLPHVNFQQYVPSQWKYFINNLKNDFPGLYDYYARYYFNTDTPTSPQHNIMGSHYRSMMVDALKEFDNNQHSNEFYNQIAWIGLKGTTAWNNLTEAERTTINTAITNAINNETHNCTN